MNKFTYVACNAPGCSCPEIYVDGNSVTLTDDFEGKVVMSYHEFFMIADNFLKYHSDVLMVQQGPL